VRYLSPVTDDPNPLANAFAGSALATRRIVDAASLAVTRIRPPGRWPGLGLAEAWDYRSICMVLARRALKVRYRQTIVGITWALIQPLALVLIFTVFFGLLARLPSQGVPYPLFYMSGLAIWQVVAKILSEGTSSVVANAALVNRVYFPRAYFPTSVAAASVVDLAVNGIALAALMLVYGFIPGVAIVTLPVLILVAYATSLGLAFLLSALNVAYRDVGVMLPLLTQIWFFTTPLVYSSSIIPARFEWLYYLNPMALVVTGFRWALLGTPPPPLLAWPEGITVALMALGCGYVVFRRRESAFADVV